MSTYVMLHGGGMGGWIWKFVAPLLRAKGHDVHTTTFTGFGERVHLIGRNIDNATHVTDIVNVLRFNDLTDCIMVGHSYAGTVLPGVAAQEGSRIRRHVYIDAIVPRSGETVVGAMGAMPPEQAAGLAAMLARGEGPVGSGVDAQQREMAKADPFRMPAERQKWLLDHLSDMPLACVVTPIAVGAETIKAPVDYMAVSHTVMTPMHARAREFGWKVHDFDGDHAILVGEPEVTAKFLLGFA